MKHFFFSVFRNIRRNPFITVINLLGLVIGFTCVIFIIFWTKNELSYDKFHSNRDKIYRLHRYFYDANGTENLHLPYVAPVIAPLLKDEFPEIKNITRVYHTDLVLSAGDLKLIQNNVSFAEPDVLKIFDFEGLPSGTDLLAEPFTVIISKETAEKYFHGDDAIGKTFEFRDESAKYAFRVTGVFKTWKGNNHFNPGFLISFSTLESFFGKGEFKNWGSNNYETFALIPVLSPDIDKKLDLFIDQYYKPTSKATKIRLEGLRDIHFNWYGSRSYVLILISIAVLILLLGSINYMNLSAALFFKRLREIKIRKVIGASQNVLAMQLLAETVLYCFFAVILGLVIVSAISGFIKISDNPLKFNIGDNVEITIGFIVLSVITGFVSGIYPAFTISSYKPVMINSVESIMKRRTVFRNVLIVFQFVVSTGLIISFLLVSKQLNYIRGKELGLDKENIIVIPATRNLVAKLDAFRQQLSQNPNIISLSASKRVPSDGLLDSGQANIVSDDNNITPVGFRIAHVRTDSRFAATYKIELLAGRMFDENISTGDGYILNETAVKKIGWKSPEDAIGRVIEYSGRRGSVIGVLSDFHYESLHTPVSPILISYDPSSFNLLAIRVIPGKISETVGFIEKSWQSYNLAGEPFSFEYLTDRYNKLYKAEDRIKMIFGYFMILAISIAVLGMAGLSLLIIERRTKEIGIRKINGATVKELILMLNWDFVKWVLVAFIISAPLAYYSMNRWLENFAYKTGISILIFVISLIIASVIAILTVSWQSWRAATRNPVNALRIE